MFELVKPVLAHEAYVLSRQDFQAGLKIVSPDPLRPLLEPGSFLATAIITMAVVLAYGLNFLIAASPLGEGLDRWLGKLSNFGLLAVRLAIAASFLYGAGSNVVFGPELSLATIPFGQIILWTKVFVGVAFILGIFTEAAALVGLVIYAIVTLSTGPYLLTYLNYLGELVALTLFGSRFLSLDRIVFGVKSKLERFRDWEVPIVRIFYGLALIYAGWSVKFVHQGLTVTVYNQWHLSQFFWNAPAEFIAAGAGVSEILIGLFIILGFARRLTVAISLVFITLSLLYFREIVWPHLMLYGISIMILVNPADRFTIDRYLVPWIRNNFHFSVFNFQNRTK